MNKIDMNSLGLTDRFINEAQLYNGLTIGRVSSQNKDLYKVITEQGEIIAEISGKMRHSIVYLSEYPAVGDFVMVDRANNESGNGIIHHILTRKSAFTRKVAGKTTEMQIIASNIDMVFICMSLNNDFNPRRLERYLAIAWDSGAIPVVILTKSDLCKDIEIKLEEISSMIIGVDVLVTTSMSDDGYKEIKKYISQGKSVAFIGSSGVGKSTLINCIIGNERQDTQEIRNDHRGRHTTTRRELIVLPEGGIVIDTPGIREIGIISADLSKPFKDIEDFSLECKYRDCTHKSEPGCAVRKAIEDGLLSIERLNSYNKLKKEAKYENLSSKGIEKVKINEMFGSMGGIKNVKKLIKEKNQRMK